MGFWDEIKKAFGGASPSPSSGGRGVDELARRLGKTEDQLAIVTPRYLSFEIPKRTGGKRRISAPDPSTKSLQRTILRKLLARLSVHEAATGFERGRSIATNARVHKGKAVLLRMDLVDFFGSTSAKRVRDWFTGIGWSGEAADLFVRLVTHEGALPQGAPTSPRLSNLLNVKLDQALTTLAKKKSATYTRYADDLTFSWAEDDGDDIHELVRGTKLLLAAAGYKINSRKRVRIRRAEHERLEVTGLVVNGDRVRLPRETRRFLRAVRSRIAKGKQATLTPQQLAGWTALESMVEKQGK